MKKKAESQEAPQTTSLNKQPEQNRNRFTWEMSAKEALKVNYLTQACSTRHQGQIKL